MLRMSVANFSGFEVICNTSAMTREIKNNAIGYMKIGKKVCPVIQIEVTYDTEWYRQVNIAEKVIIPVAIIGKTPNGVENKLWFKDNGSYLGNHDAYFDYLIPISDKWIYTESEMAKEQKFPSLEQIGKWPELCDVIDEGNGRVTIYYSSKYVLNAVATTKELKPILPILHHRQERFSMLKWDNEDGEMRPVMRFSKGNRTVYYAVEHEHTEALFQRYAVHLKEVDEHEVYYYGDEQIVGN